MTKHRCGNREVLELPAPVPAVFLRGEATRLGLGACRELFQFLSDPSNQPKHCDDSEVLVFLLPAGSQTSIYTETGQP
jgi:hypothetical protein